MSKDVDLLDERFQKAYEEVRGCIDEPTEVYVFDHVGGYEENPIHTRTFVIPWDNEQILIIQSHFWHDESQPSVVRLSPQVVEWIGMSVADRDRRGFVVVQPLESDF